MGFSQVLKTAVVGAAVAFAGVSSANAALISYTVSATTGPGLINVGSLPATLDIEKFNTSLGTLSSAVMTLSMSSVGTATAFNASGATRSLSSISSATTITVGLDIPALVLSALATVSVSSGLPTNISNGDSLPFTGLVGADSTMLALDALQRAALSGVGIQTISLDLDASSSASGTSSGGGNSNFFFYSGDAEALVNLSIEYTYNTDVPEPATAMILGASLLGLGVLRRRKRS
jgi:hypothetical protein